MMQYLVSNSQQLQGSRLSTYQVAAWLDCMAPLQVHIAGVCGTKTNAERHHRRVVFRVCALHDKQTSYWKIISQVRLSLRKAERGPRVRAMLRWLHPQGVGLWRYPYRAHFNVSIWANNCIWGRPWEDTEM